MCVRLLLSQEMFLMDFILISLKEHWLEQTRKLISRVREGRGFDDAQAGNIKRKVRCIAIQ